VEERCSNKGREFRKPWIQRYAGLVACCLALMVGFCTSLVHTWANANKAVYQSEENKKELQKRGPLVGSVPHLEDKLDIHVEEFKDFRAEQRTYNTSFQDKLDYIVRNTKER
jgi:hypothetical protein